MRHITRSATNVVPSRRGETACEQRCKESIQVRLSQWQSRLKVIAQYSRYKETFFKYSYFIVFFRYVSRIFISSIHTIHFFSPCLLNYREKLLINSIATDFISRRMRRNDLVTKGKRYNCHVIMRILICKRAFTIGLVLFPLSLPSARWPLIHTYTSEIPANYNHACLTCATVWFINHRLAAGRSRIFSHRQSVVIFSVVIFMSKCRARHRIIPDPFTNPSPIDDPLRVISNTEMDEPFDAERKWFDGNAKQSISRDRQWLLSLSADLCKLTVPKTRVRLPVRLSVWTRAKQNDGTEEGNRNPLARA